MYAFRTNQQIKKAGGLANPKPSTTAPQTPSMQTANSALQQPTTKLPNPTTQVEPPNTRLGGIPTTQDAQKRMQATSTQPPATTAQQQPSKFSKEMQSINNAAADNYTPNANQQAQIGMLKDRINEWGGVSKLNPTQKFALARNIAIAMSEMPKRSDFTEEELKNLGRSFGDANAFTTHPQAEGVWERAILTGALRMPEGMVGSKEWGREFNKQGDAGFTKIIQDFVDSGGTFPTQQPQTGQQPEHLQPDREYFTRPDASAAPDPAPAPTPTPGEQPAGDQDQDFWDEMDQINPDNIYREDEQQPGGGGGQTPGGGGQQPGQGGGGGGQQPGAGGGQGGTNSAGMPNDFEMPERSNASVQDYITGLLSQNNALNRRARTQGEQAANRSGLLNSSMGAQAGEAALMDHIVPIASQMAGQDHEMNLQLNQIFSQGELQDARIAAEKEMQGIELSSRERMALQEVNAARERLEMQIGADAERQREQLEQQERLTGMELDSREQIAAADRQARFRLGRMDIAAGERERAGAMAVQLETTYSNMVSTIMNNTEIPAGTRQEYLNHAAKVRDSNYALIEQLYSFDLEWDSTDPRENQPDLPGGIPSPYGGGTYVRGRYV